MENISYLIIKTSKLLKNSLDKKLSQHGITAAQFSVLNQIANRNCLITSAEVASNLSSDRPTISGIINRLEEKGLLEKISNPEDKRSTYLKLNQEVLELVNELRKLSDELNKEIWDMGKSDMPQVRTIRDSLAERTPTVNVVSAKELAAEQQRSLVRTFSALADRNVNMEIEINPELIAGIRIRMGDLVVENNLATELAELKSDVLKSLEESIDAQNG